MAGTSVTLEQFVLKVASRCDLACDYCYVYRMADTSFASQPRVMSREIVRRTSERIAEHVAAHRPPSITVVFHGGEPLLAGAEFMADAARIIRGALPTGTRAGFLMQSHAGLLDQPALEVLEGQGIRVGVSLDGAAEHHDLHRRRHDGQGSHEQTIRGLRALTTDRFRPLFAGLLCVIDLANDPVGVYEALVPFGPPVIDFLLPHANWSRPPPQPSGPVDAPYGRWLARAWDRWYDAPVHETQVRLFEDIIRLYSGGTGRTEQIGLSPPAYVVVDTDGALQQVDTLKSARAGAVDTGMHVATHSMDDVVRHPEVHRRSLGITALCSTCRACPLVRICGGGSYVHRYGADGGFDHPSVYCADMTYLIRHATRRLAEDIGLPR